MHFNTRIFVPLIISVSCLLCPIALADKTYSDCMLEAMEQEAGEKTLGELRSACIERASQDVEQPEESTAPERQYPLDERYKQEEVALTNPFVLLPHKNNYFLLANYHFNEMNNAPWQEPPLNESPEFDQTEAKFQVSIKVPVVQNLFRDNGHLFFAYTNLSVWQIYNTELSKPFRDINHEPEAWITFDNDWEIFGWRNRAIDTGIVHQSNGREDPLSRSWNRVYARFLFEKSHSVILFKPWYRIKEDSAKDDNPDITEYLGNFELGGATRRGKNTYSVLLRNNLSTSNNRGMVQLGWSFPVYKNIRFYTQWFYGYGETLIDYNYRNNALGIGLQYGDWL